LLSRGDCSIPTEPFTLALTGDVMLGRLVNETIAQRGFAYPWGDTLPLLHEADAVCINLECALTHHTARWAGDPRKPFFFRADTEVVETLRIGHVRFAALANNHIADFGVGGLLETVATLDAAGIAHAGAGADVESARAPAVLSVHGWDVAIVALADYPEAWCATDSAPGMCFAPISLEPRYFGWVEDTVARARAVADFVIVSMHWGPNMRLRPPRLFRDFAHRVIAAGANVFWGHSAHVLQAIELVDGRPILYDTGDFIDDYVVHPALRNDLAALFLVRVNPPVVERLMIVPMLIDDMQVNRATGTTRGLVARRLKDLCAEVGTTLEETGDGFVVRVSRTVMSRPE
jgi:poly-gamma-glutamate capsule biosynthesis protein CapA/YwtB (metallophosphatase superfamily)